MSLRFYVKSILGSLELTPFTNVKLTTSTAYDHMRNSIIVTDTKDIVTRFWLRFTDQKTGVFALTQQFVGLCKGRFFLKVYFFELISTTFESGNFQKNRLSILFGGKIQMWSEKLFMKVRLLKITYLYPSNVRETNVLWWDQRNLKDI